ncbi:MAG: HTH-type transcriptional regulator DegA [bacterium ADurb.Bin429]|nr:MAG: HTH-type transcriptional regulator DegA [bacterium ADurb.Bin429]
MKVMTSARTTRPVTLKELASRCGVSVGTASMALHDNPRVSAATRARVRAVAAEIGYDPARHELARRLVMRRYGRRALTRTIALIFRTDFYTNAYEMAIFRGILDEVTRQGHTLVTAYLNFDEHTTHTALPPTLTRGDADALILTQPPELLAPLLAELHRADGFGDRPVVNLVQRADGCSQVLTDDRDGMRQAAGHLLGLGHRHLVYFFGRPNRDIEQRRLAGLHDACAAHSLDPARHLHRLPLPWGWINPADLRQEYGTAPGHDAAAVEAVLAYLRAHPEVTGIITQNDASALYAWYALRRAGLRVPEDYSLIGCDDTDPMLDEHGRNLLTSVRLPLAEMGAEAVRLAIGRVTGALADDAVRMLPTELIVRASTAPPRLS